MAYILPFETNETVHRGPVVHVDPTNMKYIERDIRILFVLRLITYHQIFLNKKWHVH